MNNNCKIITFNHNCLLWVVFNCSIRNKQIVFTFVFSSINTLIDIIFYLFVDCVIWDMMP